MNILLDAKTQNLTSGANPSFSHTTGVNNNRILIACILIRDNSEQVNSASYGGQALSLGKRVSDGPNILSAEIWYLVNPPTGANTLAVTKSGTFADTRTIIGTFYNFVSPTLDQVGGAAGTTSATINPAFPFELIVSAAINEDGTTPTVGSGSTLLFGTDEGTWATGAEFTIQSAVATKTLSYGGWASSSGVSAVATFYPIRPSFRTNSLRPYPFSSGLAR